MPALEFEQGEIGHWSSTLQKTQLSHKVNKHWVKSIQIQSFFWTAFSCVQTEYGDLQSKYPYSVRKQENTDQKKLRIWTLFTQYFAEQFRYI